MASGHVNRTNRPNTWPHRSACDVKFSLANSEPSTHGTKAKYPNSRYSDALRWIVLQNSSGLCGRVGLLCFGQVSTL